MHIKPLASRSYCLVTFFALALAASVEDIHPMEVMLFGEKTQIMVGDLSANAHTDVLEINGKEYSFGPVWTIFGLQAASNETLNDWDVKGSCGCEQQVCGQECDSENCDKNNTLGVSKFVWFLCVARTDVNYCWNTIPANVTYHTSYFLSVEGTIALTEYGGPGATFHEPGWTIAKTRGVQNYSYNAAIKNTYSRKEISLGVFRYLENYGLVTTEAIKKLQSVPKPNIHWDKLSCSLTSKYSSSKINIPHDWGNTTARVNMFTSFKEFAILRKAEIRELPSLDDVWILGPNGVEKWHSHMNAFNYIDLCQLKFLQLVKREGKFFALLPENTRATGPYICIAIMDNASKERDLVLYEMVNGSSTWTNSTRFTGLLSPDYLDFVDLHITTKSELAFGAKEAHIDVVVDRKENETESTITLTTSIPLKCNITLSKNYSTLMETRTESPTVSKKIPLEAGYLDAHGDYSCGGIIGQFFIPNQLVQIPLSGYYIETRVSRYDNESDHGKLDFSSNGITGFFKGIGKAIGDLGSGIFGIFEGIFDGVINFFKSIGTFLQAAFIIIIVLVSLYCLGCFGKSMNNIFGKKEPKFQQIRSETEPQELEIDEKPKKNRRKPKSAMKKVTYGQFDDELEEE